MPTEIRSNLIQAETIDLLCKFKILNRFSRQEIRQLLGGEEGRYQERIAKLVRYEPRETVLKEGDFDSWVFWIVKGRFTVLKKQVVIVTFSRPGDVFGEMSILDAGTRSATVISLDKGVCLSIDMSIIDTLQDAHFRQKIQEGIQRLKSERLSLTTDQLVEEKQKVAQQKKEIQVAWKQLQEKEAALQKLAERLSEKETFLQQWEKN